MARPTPPSVELDAWVTRHALSFFVTKVPPGEEPDLQISLRPDRLVFSSNSLPLRIDGATELHVPYDCIQRLRVPRWNVARCTAPRTPAHEIHAACEMTVRLPAEAPVVAPGFAMPPANDDEEEIQHVLGHTTSQTMTIRFSVEVDGARALRAWRKALRVSGGAPVPTRLVMWSIAVLALARDVVELLLYIPAWVYPAMLALLVVGGIAYAVSKGVFGPASPQTWARFIRVARHPSPEESG